MKCEDCLYEKICYMREISNDIKEEIKEFGCMNFTACADVREVKDDWVVQMCEKLKTTGSGSRAVKVKEMHK